MNIYIGNITEIDEGELNITFTEIFSNVVGCCRWPTRVDDQWVVAKDIWTTLTPWLTSIELLELLA